MKERSWLYLTTCKVLQALDQHSKHISPCSSLRSIRACSHEHTRIRRRSELFQYLHSLKKVRSTSYANRVATRRRPKRERPCMNDDGRGNFFEAN